MPIAIRERTLNDIEQELTEARAELEAAEEAERQASERVTAAREAVGLGQLVRRALLTVQRSNAEAQEATEQAKAKVRALERLAVQGRESVAAAAHRVRVDRSAVLRVKAAALKDRIGAFLVDVREQGATLDQEVDAFNREAGGAFLAPQRALGAYPSWDHVLGDLARLGRVFPPPRQSRPTTAMSEEPPSV